MAFVIVEKGNSGDIGKKFPIGEGNILIGRRATDCTPDIALHDDFVSRRHAEIAFDRDHFTLRDLNSTNGTALDGLRIEPGRFYRLKHESVIGLGVSSGTEARVVLRFKESTTATTARITTGEFGSPAWLRIDTEKGEVWIDEKQLALSRKEYDLILFLNKKAGRFCQRDELISGVWPEVLDPGGVSDAAIDQLIHRLRLKIEFDPSHPKRLISRKGFGCMLV